MKMLRSGLIRYSTALALMLAAGAAPAADLLQLKAAFIYRFAQLTWPPPPAREFTYCVAGDAECRKPCGR
jgi:hypothetical protein